MQGLCLLHAAGKCVHRRAVATSSSLLLEEQQACHCLLAQQKTVGLMKRDRIYSPRLQRSASKARQVLNDR